jgi:cytoskeletal protein RodZ
MDMKTFKLLEFAAIFGVLGWFWWNQRQARLRQENAEQQGSDTQASESAEDPSKSKV